MTQNIEKELYKVVEFDVRTLVTYTYSVSNTTTGDLLFTATDGKEITTKHKVAVSNSDIKAGILSLLSSPKIDALVIPLAQDAVRKELISRRFGLVVNEINIVFQKVENSKIINDSVYVLEA